MRATLSNPRSWILAVALLGASACGAQWSTNPYENNYVTTNTVSTGEFSSMASVADGQGGCILAYLMPTGTSGFSRADLYATRIGPDAEGAGGGGVLVREHVGDLEQYAVVADGWGGAFIAFSDENPQNGNVLSVYVQHLDAEGGAVWTPGGVLVTISLTGAQSAPALTLDGAGGIVVVWQDARNTATTGQDIYGQRISSGGSRLWGSTGRAISTAAAAQSSPRIVRQGDAWYMVAWYDSRNAATSGYDIFGATIDGDAAAVYGDRPLAYAAGTEYLIDLAAGRSGDVFLLWTVDTAGDENVRVQRFGSNGALYWGQQGLLLTADTADQRDPSLSPDPDGGAFVSWTDYRATATSGFKIRAQHVDAGGGLQWGAEGIEAGPANGNQYEAVSSPDDVGGVLLMWRDLRTPVAEGNIYGQHFTANGTRAWGSTGRLVSGAPASQQDVRIVADGRNGVIGAWIDYRTYPVSLYAQRLGYFGRLGDAAPSITMVADLPGDQGGVVMLDWRRSYLDALGTAAVADYTIWRRYPGISLATVVAGAPAAAADLAKLGWSYVGRVDAALRELYSVEAPTYGDADYSGFPPTEFLVIANGVTAGEYWESTVVAGQSLDNLAPGAPLGLTAVMVGRDAHLAWSRSYVDDEDLLQYRIHRAGTPRFEPTPENLVGVAQGESFVDWSVAGGTWYYAVLGEDVHGNVGAKSNEVAATATTAVGERSAGRLRLAASPNPFNPRTTLAFAVPAAGRAVLTIYDLRGRTVATLLDAELQPGRHTVTWAGRDAAGAPVPSGAYVAGLDCGGGRIRMKILLAK